MAADLKSLFEMLMDNPEKGALLLVILTGAWRWIRELFREKTEDDQHNVFVERILKDDWQLRAENARLRAENTRLQRLLRADPDDESK